MENQRLLGTAADYNRVTFGRRLASSRLGRWATDMYAAYISDALEQDEAQADVADYDAHVPPQATVSESSSRQKLA